MTRGHEYCKIVQRYRREAVHDVTSNRQSSGPTSRLMLLTEPIQTSAMSGYLRARSFTCTVSTKLGFTGTACLAVSSCLFSPVQWSLLSQSPCRCPGSPAAAPQGQVRLAPAPNKLNIRLWSYYIGFGDQQLHQHCCKTRCALERVILAGASDLLHLHQHIVYERYDIFCSSIPTETDVQARWCRETTLCYSIVLCRSHWVVCVLITCPCGSETMSACHTSRAILPTVPMAFLASFSSMSFTYSVSSVAMS